MSAQAPFGRAHTVPANHTPRGSAFVAHDRQHQRPEHQSLRCSGS